jgi:hypothetical protein
LQAGESGPHAKRRGSLSSHSVLIWRSVYPRIGLPSEDASVVLQCSVAQSCGARVSSLAYGTGTQGDRQTPTFERVKSGKVQHERLKFQHRMTRTRVNGGKLPEFGWLPWPLWIRRVLVRAQEWSPATTSCRASRIWRVCESVNPPPHRYIDAGRPSNLRGEQCNKCHRCVEASLHRLRPSVWPRARDLG